MTLFNYPAAVLLVLLLATSVMIELGFRLARRTRVNDDADRHEQIAGLRDSLLIFLGLILGFTFSMAVSRYEQRRQLLVDEANAIGTTALRARLLPEAQADQAAALLRQYTDARVEGYVYMLGSPQMNEILSRCKQIQNELWDIAVKTAQQDRSPVTVSFVQTLNETIDLDAKRLAARENRIPDAIWVLIVILTVVTAFTTGFGQRRRFWFSAIMLPLIFAVSLSLIADLDSPNRGLIRVGTNPMVRLQQDLGR